MIKKGIAFVAATALLAGLAAGCSSGTSSSKSSSSGNANEASTSGKVDKASSVRLAFFPNITHSQALVGISNGGFQKALGSVKLEPKQFNAGPAVIEALFAGQIDIAYIGPNPAINGYTKSNGEALRVVAGATSGGAVFVVRKDAGIGSDKDFAGKKFASPQAGNTQDVALRSYLKEKGYTLADKGGNVSVIPTENANTLALFKTGELDGAWVPEPWGARLVKEGNGTIFLDERDLWPNGKFTTAVVIVRTEFLKQNPGIVEKFLAEHVALTEWIGKHPDDAKKLVNAEIKKLTNKSLASDVLDQAFSRLEVTYDPISGSLTKSAQSAYEAGFLKKKPDLGGIFDLSILNTVLEGKALSVVK